ncbi:MAG TPA: MBL fold metallo-hydrolase [Anaerolineae bacterium]|nr:MBL fold metallo-hydrolase [Anaerolineae bacterium]HPL30679.1 MBL fold metallo-hydrolase [Anaerolineae bacterium]
MQLTFLGTGTGLPTRGRAPSGLLARIGDACLLFDSGSGTTERLLAHGVEPTQLDYLYYTHLHSDHTADLVPLLQAMDLSRRSRDLHLTAPAAFWPFLDGLLALQPWARPATYQLRRYTAELDPYCGPTWSVSAAPTHHMPGSHGYRIEAEGKVVAISGDAAPCPDLVALARGADLLVLECSFPDELAKPDHLTPSQAAHIAAAAGVGHLVLTHFYPSCREPAVRAQAARAFAGPLTLARDGMVLAV